jgi:hypothetical protein
MTAMETVTSSSVHEIGYVSSRRLLLVTFSESGKLYAYEGVEPEVYEAFMEAPSKGEFLNTQIKPFYDYRALT